MSGKVLVLLGAMMGIAGAVTTLPQTDWHGGPGTPGPVRDWGTAFFTSDSVDYLYEYGRISLAVIVDPLPDPKAHPIGIMPSWLDKKIETGDLDGDGDIDVVISGNNGLRWFENNGEGRFAEVHPVYNSLSVYVGYDMVDFNFDGASDVVLSVNESGQVFLWLNDGKGNFPIADLVGIHPNVHQVSARDHDNDGDIDIVSTSHHNTGTTTVEGCWFENQGDNLNFTCHEFAGVGKGSARRINTGDLDSDGDIDFTSSAQHGTYWLENRINETGKDTCFVSHVVDSTVENIYDWIGDVNKDGYPDIIAVDLYGFSPTLWTNDGHGNFTGKCLPNGVYNPEGAVSIDIDYDGDVDILQSFWQTGPEGEIGTYQNNGTQEFAYHHFVNYPYSCDLQVADISGNGFTDLIGSTHGPGASIDWWERLDRFCEFGVLTSSIVDVDEPVIWMDIDWDDVLKEETSVKFLVRTGNYADNLPYWSNCDTLNVPSSLEGNVEQETRYLQYKVILSTENTNYTPLLYEVRFTYDCMLHDIVVAPDQDSLIDPDGVVDYLLVVRNNGNADDVVDLHVDGPSLSGWSAELLDDGGNPLTDPDADGNFEVGPLAARGGEVDVILRITAPGDALGGDVDTTRVVGESNEEPGVTDEATLTTTVRTLSALTIVPDSTDSTYAGVPIRYRADVTNLGNVSEVIGLQVHSGHPWSQTCLDSTGTVTVTDAGQLAAYGGSSRVWLEITPPDTVTDGTVDTSYLAAFSTHDETVRDSIRLITTVLNPQTQAGVIIEPDTFGTVEAGKTITYPMYVVNLGNEPDDFALSSTSDLSWPADFQATTGSIAPGETLWVDLSITPPAELASIVGDPLFTNTEHRLVWARSVSDETVQDSATIITLAVPPLDIHNFPNPFSGSTTFIYSIPRDGLATLGIYNRAGEHIITLFADEPYEPGIHTWPWDGVNLTGESVAPGVYLYTLTFKPDDGDTKQIIKKALMQP